MQARLFMQVQEVGCTCSWVLCVQNKGREMASTRFRQ